MKLELKHLTPYYEHNLKVLNTEDNKIYFLNGLSNPYKTVRRDFITLQIREPNATRSWSFVLGNEKGFTVKPLLRPLSDLTKEIEVNGEKLIPCDYWMDTDIHGVKYAEEFNNMAKYNYFDGYLPYYVVAKLHEWHFDTQDLIKQGLAIDINTI